MLLRQSEIALKASLIEALDNWWTHLDDATLEDFDAYIGDNAIELMATASLAVLVAIHDAQDYLSRQDLIKED